nr:retrotransposon Orf1 [Tanacetum cinerariifolium]
MGDENPIRTLGDYFKPSHEGYKNTMELPVENNAVPLRSDTIRLVQNGCSFHGLQSEDPNQRLKDFLKLVESLDLDGENRERTHFAKSVKAIALPQDVLTTSDRRLIEIETQVQRLMEAHLAPTQPTQVNKITTSCEICNGPYDTQYYMENPEQAFVDYASSRTDEAKVGSDESGRKVGERVYREMAGKTGSSINAITIYPKQPEESQGNEPDVAQEEKGNFTYVVDFMIVEDISSIIDPRLSQVVLGRHFIEVSNMTYDLPKGVVRFTNENNEVAYKMPHKIEQYNSLSNLEKEHIKSIYLRDEEDKRRGVDYVMNCGDGVTINTRRHHHDTCDELMKTLTASNAQNANPSSSTSNSKFLDPKKKIEIMSWLKDSRIVDSKNQGLKVFVGNFTCECNFMILEDTTSIIDHHLREVVFGKPFVRKTGFVYDQEEGMITFEKDNRKITFKMPHKMEAFNHTYFKDVNIDCTPPFVLDNNDDHWKTYYSNSLTLGLEYREDESISKEIRHLMKLERETKKKEGEVTYGLVTLSLATRLINKENRFLRGNPMFIFLAY